MLEEGAPRTQACQYKISGLVLSHRGELMLCPIGGSLGSCLENKPHELLLSKEARNAKVTLERNNCVSCYPYNFYRNEIAKDMFKYLAFYVRSRLSRT
jgi:hypothetical protein